jgi:hypothetical protein
MNARKLKNPSLVVPAVLAMCAPASQAAGGFTWASGTVKLDATQDIAAPRQRFVFDAFSIECNEFHGNAAVAGTSASDATGTGITYQTNGSADTCWMGIGNATISMNGCVVTFTAGETLNSMETTSAEAHIACPSEPLSVSMSGFCTIEVDQQTIKGGHVVYRTITNAGGAGIHAVTAELTLSGITYEQTGIICPNGGTKHASNGLYISNITIIGTNASGGQTSVEVS